MPPSSIFGREEDTDPIEAEAFGRRRILDRRSGEWATPLALSSSNAPVRVA